MLTHFGVLVGLMVGLFGLLSGILGVIWKIATHWQKTQDMIGSIQADISKINETIHNDVLTRIVTLEKRRR
jgi:hypothetical protein